VVARRGAVHYTRTRGAFKFNRSPTKTRRLVYGALVARREGPTGGAGRAFVLVPGRRGGRPRVRVTADAAPCVIDPGTPRARPPVRVRAARRGRARAVRGIFYKPRRKPRAQLSSSYFHVYSYVPRALQTRRDVLRVRYTQ
jgi:hypothetical protein